MTRLLGLLFSLGAISCTSDGATGPDGTRLEIVHVYGPLAGLSPNEPQNLVLMSADGSMSRTLMSLPGSEWMPAWSPDQVPTDGDTPLVVLPEQPNTECLGASWR